MGINNAKRALAKMSEFTTHSNLLKSLATLLKIKKHLIVLKYMIILILMAQICYVMVVSSNFGLKKINIENLI